MVVWEDLFEIFPRMMVQFSWEIHLENLLENC